MSERVVVTGATGLIGKQLCKQLIEAGHEVRSLSRSPKPHPISGVKTYTWDIPAGRIDSAAFENATVLIHLAGENLADGRWTEERRKRIWESRIQSAELLHKALKEQEPPVHTVIGASAIGIYQHSRRPIDETGAYGTDFPAQVCKAWEDAHASMAEGRRLIVFRIGIVLGKESGAFPKLAAPVKAFVGTWVGNGNQALSWIHVRDAAGLMVHSIANKEMDGVYNAVANEPVNMRFLIKQMGRYLHRPVWPIGVPGWLLRLVYGEMSQVVLTGDTVISSRLGYTGYRFKYAYLYEALGDLIRRRKG